MENTLKQITGVIKIIGGARDNLRGGRCRL